MRKKNLLLNKEMWESGFLKFEIKWIKWILIVVLTKITLKF